MQDFNRNIWFVFRFSSVYVCQMEYEDGLWSSMMPLFWIIVVYRPVHIVEESYIFNIKISKFVLFVLRNELLFWRVLETFDFALQISRGFITFWLGTFRWPLVHELRQWTWSMDYLNGLPMGYLKWITLKNCGKHKIINARSNLKKGCNWSQTQLWNTNGLKMQSNRRVAI